MKNFPFCILGTSCLVQFFLIAANSYGNDRSFGEIFETGQMGQSASYRVVTESPSGKQALVEETVPNSRFPEYGPEFFEVYHIVYKNLQTTKKVMKTYHFFLSGGGGSTGAGSGNTGGGSRDPDQFYLLLDSNEFYFRVENDGNEYLSNRQPMRFRSQPDHGLNNSQASYKFPNLNSCGILIFPHIVIPGIEDYSRRIQIRKYKEQNIIPPQFRNQALFGALFGVSSKANRRFAMDISTSSDCLNSSIYDLGGELPTKVLDLTIDQAQLFPRNSRSPYDFSVVEVKGNRAGKPKVLEMNRKNISGRKIGLSHIDFVNHGDSVGLILTRKNSASDERLYHLYSKDIHDHLLENSVLREVVLAKISVPSGEIIRSAKLQRNNVAVSRGEGAKFPDIMKSRMSIELATSSRNVYYLSLDLNKVLGRHPFKEEVTVSRRSYDSFLRVETF